MSRPLQDIRRDMEQPAGHGNVGLASNFLDLANSKVKRRGVRAGDAVEPPAGRCLGGQSGAAADALRADDRHRPDGSRRDEARAGCWIATSTESRRT